MNTPSIIALIILILTVIFVGIIIYSSTKQRLVISKKSILWFLPIFVFLFALYITAAFYKKGRIDFIILVEGIVAALKTFAFEVNSQHTSQLINENELYAVTFYLLYFLAVLTVLASVLSFIKEFLLNIIRVTITKKGEVDYVIGFNDAAIEYALVNKKKTIILADEAPDDNIKKILELEQIPYLITSLTVEKLKRKLNLKVRNNFISFSEKEEKYQSLIDLIIAMQSIKSKGIYLYLETKYHEMDVVRSQFLLKEKSNPSLFINTFSRYELICRKFVTEHTIPKFLAEDDFNENRSIKEDKNINVFFLGFGKINASLFPMFCQNNQLTTTTKEGLAAKVVNYYMIDENQASVDTKRLDYLLGNYLLFQSDLPAIEPICNYQSILGNLSSEKTINQIKQLASNPNDLNIFIVSFGTDFENIETSSWILSQFNRLNTKVICRVKQTKITNPDIICFGNELEIIDRKYIVGEELQIIAKHINNSYHEQLNNNENTETLWRSLNQIELWSNYYSGMNLTFRLHLLGFELTNDKDAVSISKDEFMSVYNKNTPKDYSYDNYFLTHTRNVVAYSEKLRWNAFYVFNNYRPMLFEDVTYLDAKKYVRKNIASRTHLCLTSHKGLDVLHEKVVIELNKRFNGSITKDDIELYSYDYMIFDNVEFNLIDVLFKMGYKIVKIAKN